MKSSEVLKKAKELIQNPKNWCQEYYSLDINSNPVNLHSEYAVKFCASGALDRLFPEPVIVDERVSVGKYTDSKHFLINAAKLLNLDKFNTIVTVNDYTDHETVMKMYDLAIQLAETVGD